MVIKLLLTLLLMILLTTTACDYAAPADDPLTSTESTNLPSKRVEVTETPASENIEEYEIIYNATVNNFLPYDTPFDTDSEGHLVLTREQAIEDYLYLWKTLEENAPYLQYMPNYPQWTENTPKMIKERYIYDLEAIPGTIELKAFSEMVDNALADLEWVGHMSVLSGDHYRLFKSNLQKISQTDDPFYSDLNTRQYELLSSQKTYEYYEYVDGHTGEVSGMDEEDFKSYYDQIVRTSKKGGWPYIKIYSFGYSIEFNEYMVAELRSFCEQNKDAENIIIDIRGNPGGSTYVWMEGLVAPLTFGDPLSYYQITGAISGELNTYLWGGEYESELPEECLEYFPDIGSDFLNQFDALDYSEVQTQSSSVGDFRGDLYLLVDNGCYSASEQFTVFCKQSGFATVVGCQTGGAGIGRQPYAFPLPNSGMLIYYEPWIGLNEDRTCNQIVGTKPDIDVGTRDALQECLDIINDKE